MSEVYELATIADLLKIPPDKLSECLRDIEYAINLCHFAGGDEAAGMSFDAFTWTDDGKHSVNMAMNGEPFLSLDVTDSGPVQASEARGDWVLVPREATQAMLDAPPNAWPADAKITWDAMISAHTQAGPVATSPNPASTTGGESGL